MAKNVTLRAPSVERGNEAVESEGDLGAAVGGNDLLETSAGNDVPLAQDRNVGVKLLELRQVVRGVDDSCTFLGQLTDRA